MITAESITTQSTVDLFHAVATATCKARRLMRDAQDGNVDPHAAAERLNAILATIKSDLEALS